MKYCTHCGTQLPDDAQFCPGCGKAAEGGTSPTPARKIPLPALLAILAVALVAGVIFALTQGTLTHLDYTGKTLATYRRPTYDMAPTPLPSSDWGAYTLVEGDTTGYNPYGPSVDFIVDAFRFGICPYQRLSDNGDGTMSIYCPSGPEGFFTVFSFTSEGEDTYLTIYDADGNVRYRYLRTAA